MGWADFSKNTHFAVGVGSRVKFWQDVWCGDQPLQLAFLRLYGIATYREASIEFSLLRLGVGEGEVGMFVSFEILMIGS